MNRMLCLCCVVLFLLTAFAAGDDDEITQASKQQISSISLWSSDEVLAGVIDAVDDQGIRFRINNTVVPTQLPWYDIRDVTSRASNSGAFNIAKYNDFKEQAHKAHSRLIRGDYSGANSVYQSIKSDYFWKRGKQSADICFGLMLCRVDAGNRVQAIRPLLSWYGSLVDEFSNPDVHMLPHQSAVYDIEYGLVTSLPPVFIADDRKQTLGKVPQGEGYSAHQLVLGHGYELVFDLQLHRTQDARDQLREISAFTLGRDNRDAGLDLFEDMVIVQAHPDAEKREAARDRLARRIRSHPETWIEVWSRLGIGVSLLADTDTNTRERGAIQLIHILVRLKHIDPGLTQLAGELVNEYFVDTDRPKWGAKLMLESLYDFDPRPVRLLSEEQSAHE